MKVQADTEILDLAISHYENNVLKEGTGSPFEMPEQDPNPDPGKDLGVIASTALDFAQEGFTDAVKWFDETAKERGLTGLGEIDPQRYSKVGFLVLKKRIPTEWLENSPEALFGLMTFRILAQNGFEYRKLKNEEENE